MLRIKGVYLTAYNIAVENSEIIQMYGIIKDDLLNEVGNMVETIFNNDRLFGI